MRGAGRDEPGAGADQSGAAAHAGPAFTQHPRPAYYDREPGKTPQAMGYSVRTSRMHYTEWRAWDTGKTIARELYDAQKDPAEMHNVVDSPQVADAQHEAESCCVRSFHRNGKRPLACSVRHHTRAVAWAPLPGVA